MPFSQRLPRASYTAVQADLRAALAAEGLAGALFDDPLDVAYLTGFSHFPCERPVAVWLTADSCVLLVPELEREHARAQDAAAEILAYPEYPGVVPPFAVLAGAVGAVPAAGHGAGLAVGRLGQLTAAFPATGWRSTGALAALRLRKRPEEIALHREAARIADRMLAAGRALVTEALAAGGPLPTEAELAAHVTTYGQATMYAEHTDVVVVPMLTGALVYAGANSAFPHGLPSGYRLRPGEAFQLSLGCAVGGRFVESERTFLLGEPTAEQRRYYTAVQEAQETGTRALRPGTTCAAANRTCLDVIRSAGLGGYLRHRQGHGIGLGFHEPPWVEDGDPTELAAGMLVSSEPGVYVPGHAGYRISDTVLVTGAGPERLTGYPRDLADVVIA